ncbi:MAG TPA: hypothetical protein VNN80_15665 [Polyangiaceae bacterium]|nr:hypothetical protein [Polyangiaceae bacterium]
MSAVAGPRWLRVARRACVALLALFVIVIAAACWCYPGGSWTSPNADGFSLLRNFWCDLLRSHAINGGDNALGKLLASAGFAALGLGLYPFWWVAAALLGRGRGAWVWGLGTASGFALLAMALLPSDRQPVLHGVVALAGGAQGIVAAALCVATGLPGESRFALRRWSGALALLAALFHALLYVQVAYLGGPESVLHPAVQKLATAALLLWMLATVARSRPAPSAPGAPSAPRRPHTSAV